MNSGRFSHSPPHAQQRCREGCQAQRQESSQQEKGPPVKIPVSRYMHTSNDKYKSHDYEEINNVSRYTRTSDDKCKSQEIQIIVYFEQECSCF